MITNFSIQNEPPKCVDASVSIDPTIDLVDGFDCRF